MQSQKTKQVRINILFLAVLTGLFSLIYSCGLTSSDNSNSDPTPTPNDTATGTPSTSVTIPPSELKYIWASSSAKPIIVRYDKDGNNQPATLDLSSRLGLSQGGISAISLLNSTTLIAMVDPAETTGGEYIISIDTTTFPAQNSLKGLGWFFDSNITTIANTSMLTFISGKVFVSLTKSIELLTYLNVNDRPTRVKYANGPYIAANLPGVGTTICDGTTLNGAAGIFAPDNTPLLLTYSTGETSKINVIGGLSAAPTCVSSYSYTTDGVTTKTDIPISSTQMADGKIYVLYQNTQTTPKIISYDFDGTSLSKPTIICQDIAYLGSSTTQPTAITKFDTSNFLVTSGDSIYKMPTAAGCSQTKLFTRGFFSQNLTSIIAQY